MFPYLRVLHLCKLHLHTSSVNAIRPFDMLYFTFIVFRSTWCMLHPHPVLLTREPMKGTAERNTIKCSWNGTGHMLDTSHRTWNVQRLFPPFDKPITEERLIILLNLKYIACSRNHFVTLPLFSITYLYYFIVCPLTLHWFSFTYLFYLLFNCVYEKCFINRVALPCLNIKSILSYSGLFNFQSRRSWLKAAYVSMWRLAFKWSIMGSDTHGLKGTGGHGSFRKWLVRMT